MNTKLLSLLAAACGSAVGLAQSWSGVAAAPAPSARNSHATAFDATRGVTVLFGGQTAVGIGANDLWEWNGASWAQRPTAHAPAPRWSHAVAYDARRSRLVMFGGFVQGAPTFDNETWEWSGAAWTKRVTPTAPSARGYAAMSYDAARGVVVMFGGYNGSADLGDTWEWDGTSWTQRTPATSPSPRHRCAVAYDAARRQTMLFGGGTFAAANAETWSYDGVTWTLRPAAAAPSPRWDTRMAYDALRDRIVLHGGANAGYTTNYGDTWEWDGAAWALRTSAGLAPRHGHALAYDPLRASVVSTGGRDVGGFLGGTAEFALPRLRVPAQYATIQAAIAAAPSPACVLVAPGTYNEAIDFLGKDLQVVGVGGAEVTTIDGNGRNNACVSARNGEPITARILGFTLTRGAGKPFPSSYGYDYYGGGVHVGGANTRLRIENCRILDNATTTGTFGGGICVTGSNCRAEARGCLIARNRAWASGGATLVDGGGSTMLLERCTITLNTANAWAFGHQGGVSMANGGGVVLDNCIVWGNAGYQIRAFGAPYNAGTSAVATYTCVQGGFGGTGNISGDPLFVNSPAGDFRLALGSPAVNAGNPASLPDPDGTRADMGSLPRNLGPGPVFATFGQGCVGAGGVATLGNVGGSLPRLGSTFTMRLTGLPNSAVAVPFGFLGYSNQAAFGLALPFSLGLIGMPASCMQYVDPTDGLFFTLANVGGQADWTLQIPNDPLLQNGACFAQALVLDQSLATPFQAVSTNAAELVFRQ